VFEFLSSDSQTAHLFLVFSTVVILVLGLAMTVLWGVLRCAELRHRKAELEITLKQQMVERGMTAAEIRQVVEASPDRLVM
jgi:hypothetical protein